MSINTGTGRSASALDAAIGFKLRQVRQNKRISQIELAEKCGISRQQLRKYELGRNRLNVEKLIQITNYLEVDINELLNNAQGKEASSSLYTNYSFKNIDQYAAKLWSRIRCKRQKRAIVEIMDLLQSSKEIQKQPMDTEIQHRK